MPNDKKPLIIANWKMKLSSAQSAALAKEIKAKAGHRAEVAICPSFTCLEAVGKILAGGEIKLGAQDCFWENNGAFTGEVSADQLKEAGCEMVIIGHSERRQHLLESDDMVHKKVRLAVQEGLTPIVCVGETFDQRQIGAADYVLIQQTTKALEGIEINPKQKVIIAYEPVWVIGSGQAIEPSQAQMAHQVIRHVLFDLFPSGPAKNNFSVIYGGSVDGGNVRSFTGLEEIDGILVGGASLKAEDFLAVIRNA
ncbi:MAG: triose-phosphate isomerase [Candidatus Buchananbacteria bacterium RIFCSPHIGHO2_02_FULL_45_11b]|uniref:Triosephosphate isomerase n=2 Tax=Candidatus Buchananiibacteriota TaxID=1817903 RepID=A0A1G1YHY1_9BACT|nr:MAG: triose-phosphate isomerase [Candidatus Buchananbacteria bacterium RIFCSPHIGHO2_01_FULL_46_12]OGY51968.1 MAG: triose-phosphate isomerase [Candidatus Buchananbacteria bacterium RIFCSPHIGHO2_02_FULL_45_11b]